MPHEGGQRFGIGSVPAEMIIAWLSEGLQDDAATLPARQEGRVLPGPVLLKSPAKWQQLAVDATFADGKTRDVTRLTVFSSSDPSIADVIADRAGRVQAAGRGRDPVPLSRADDLGPHHLSGTARGLRLAEPAGDELRR